MATVRWLGEATAVAQVDTFTPANVEINDIFTLTVTGGDGRTHSVSFTATAATVANVTDGLTTAWNAETNTLCTPITAADNTTNLTLTADTAGNGFSVASSATDGGGTDDQTLTRAATTANAGPKDWSSTANWSTGAVPGNAASQDVYLDNWTGDILYGLDQSGISNTLSSLNIDKTFTGNLGANGSTGTVGDYLQIKATAVNIGQYSGTGSPAGSGRIKVDTGSTASTINVYDTASTVSDTNKAACRLLANSASTVLNVLKGNVSLAGEPGETATVSTVNVSFRTRQTTDSTVDIGSGVTITTLNDTGGDTTLRCGLTTVNHDAGSLETSGSGAITTMNVNGGSVTPKSTGTITTLDIEGGDVDLTKSPTARTITTVKLDATGSLKYDPGVITFTNGIDSDKPVTLTAAATV